MVANHAFLARNSPLIYRFTALSSKPVSHFPPPTRFPANPVQITGFRTSASLHSYPHSLNSGPFGALKDSGRSQIGFGQMGLGYFRVASVSDGGSGGSSDGNSGGRGDGGGGGGEGATPNGDGDSWSILSWYLALLEKYPVLTKAVTSAFLTLFGDLICQLVIDKVPSLDLKRTFMFTFLGLVLVGPTLHFWYLYLSKLVTLSGSSGAILRLLLDQFIFSPIFIGVFLSTLVTLEGRPNEVVPKLQQEWFSAVVANWQLWIPFQFLNFRFVPQQFQVLAANFVALAWNVILSFKAHKEILPKKVS